MSLASLTPRVREALGLNASYDALIIPALIKRSAQRLLRDYNFPKSLVRDISIITGAGQSVTLPATVGKILAIRFRNPVDNTYSLPLVRREGLTLAVTDGSAWRWWQEGTAVRFSNPFDYPAMHDWEIITWYQTISPDVATWIYDDFEDVLFYHSVYRGAAENRKPEVQQAFAPLWQEEQQSLAIYLHELEFDDLEMVQREERQIYRERYPAS